MPVSSHSSNNGPKETALSTGPEAMNGTRYLAVDLPEDILAALGPQTAHVPLQIGRETPFADQWLESSFPKRCRYVLEDWYEGKFDGLDRVIFSRGDDASQRLFYYICELQRRGILKGPDALIFDLGRIPRRETESHNYRVFSKFCQELGLSTADLQRGIEIANLRRKKLKQLADANLTGSALDTALRASLGLSFENYEISKNAKPNAAIPHSILLAGSLPPDSRIHSAIDACGGVVVGHENDLNFDRLGKLLDPKTEDPIREICKNVAALPAGPRSFSDRSIRVLEAAKSSKVRGVIIWVTEEDEAWSWLVPVTVKLLKNANIPTCVLTRRDWLFCDDSPSLINEFIKGLS